MIASEIDVYRKHFNQYTDQFIGSDQYKNQNYILKKEHTKRVCKNIQEISRSINLSKKESYIAETIALYHDIGRFVQFQKYGTFSDSRSENHALLGVKVLEEEKVLNISNNRKTILTAISVHNKKFIPNNIKGNVLRFSKLIRDADKIDILYVLSNYYTNKQDYNPALDLDLIEKPIYSEKVLNDFFANRGIDTKDLQTRLDFKILQISWLYDINFSHSLYLIKKRKYIEKIISVLPETYLKKQIYSHIQNIY